MSASKTSTEGSRSETTFPRLEPIEGFQPERFLVVLGDQLDPRYLESADFDPERDLVVMMEVAEEARHVPSHKARTVLFLSAMRHFALDLQQRGIPLAYSRLDDSENRGSFTDELQRLMARYGPSRITVLRPGEWRVLHALEKATRDAEADFELLEDPHFYATPETFSSWAEGRKELVMEYYYRLLRKREGLLLDADDQPEGGQWNFDKENRKSLGRDAPSMPPVPRFEPDEVTREVLDLVERRFPEAPGRLDAFAWPVTRDQAKEALHDFLERRLPYFGDYQDAMQQGEPWLFHSLLSPALNLKLLDPREVIGGAIDRYRAGDAPLNAVEGFVRQIIGWREFIRGVYWHEGPTYQDRNGLDQHAPLPEMYWSGETEMVCLRESLGQVLEHGYGHHIQRLMVTGNYALLSGVHPRAISDWYLGMYVDGIDWVTLPNTLGMMMHADGGVVGTKPYAASGRYVQRMSDYCSDCRFDPGARTGEDACPLTTLYWDFLDRQQSRLGDNRRMAFAWKNLERLDLAERDAIRRRAEEIRGAEAETTS